MGESSRLPYFRDLKNNLPLSATHHLSKFKNCPLGLAGEYGRDLSFRVLPYTMQTDYQRAVEKTTYRSVVLENNDLKATFLPHLGARLISLFDKHRGKELLFAGDIQPAWLGLRNAWFAGGIEWNIGHLGHTFFTCEPLYCSWGTGIEGREFLRFYEYERLSELFFQMDFSLTDRTLWGHFKVINPAAKSKSVYWWTNIAVPNLEGVRILSNAKEAVYSDLITRQANLMKMPFYLQKDVSLMDNLKEQTVEYFMQQSRDQIPWEVAVYPDQRFFYELSTQELCSRKVFFWGNHEGGSRWQEYLTGDDRGYIEIQAGITPTQPQTITIPPDTVWSWTQGFGELVADRSRISDGWDQAVNYTNHLLRSKRNTLFQMDRLMSEQSNRKPDRIEIKGSGWGAIELERLNRVIPSMPFYETTKVRPWKNLVQTGRLQLVNQGDMSYMIQQEYFDLLKEIPSEARNHWEWLHLGINFRERLEIEQALENFRLSTEKTPSVLSLRCEAIMYAELKNEECFLDRYAQAIRLAQDSPGYLTELYIEYVTWLNCLGLYRRAYEFDRSHQHLRKNDYYALQMIITLVEVGKLSEAKELLLSREFSCIKEDLDASTVRLWQKVSPDRVPYKINFSMKQ